MNDTLKVTLTVASVALLAVVAYGLYKKSQLHPVTAANPNNSAATQQATQAQSLQTTAIQTGGKLLDSFIDYVQE